MDFLCLMDSQAGIFRRQECRYDEGACEKWHYRILLVFGLFLALSSTLTPNLNMQTLDDPRKWLPPAWRETASGLSPPRAREVAVGTRAKISRREEQVSVKPCFLFCTSVSQKKARGVVWGPMIRAGGGWSLLSVVEINLYWSVTSLLRTLHSRFTLSTSSSLSLFLFLSQTWKKVIHLIFEGTTYGPKGGGVGLFSRHKRKLKYPN